MNSLSAFLKLDLFKLLSASRLTLIAVALSLAVAFFAPGQVVWLLYLDVFISYCMALTLMSLDEQYHSSYLYGALPASRNNIVTGRFCFYFVTMTALSIIYLILGCITPFGKPAENFVFWINFGYCISLIYVGFVQALCYRFKYSSVRMVAIFSFCLLISFSSIIKNISTELTLSLSISSPLPSFIMAVSGLIIFAAFLLLGQRLYRHKDIKDS